jgi:uncharacterized LabA/DUF88 family protein
LEKVQLFLDYANINRTASELGFELNYETLLHEKLVSIDEGRNLIDAFAYVPKDPRQEHQNDRDIDNLWKAGFFVNSKVGTIAGDTYKCDFDVEMTMDIMRIAHNTKPDIVVIATGDSDFIPLVKELRNMGIRVEIASFQENVSRHLQRVSSGFIDLNFYLEEENEDFESLREEYENSYGQNNENENFAEMLNNETENEFNDEVENGLYNDTENENFNNGKQNYKNRNY